MKLLFLFLFLPSVCFSAPQYFWVSQSDGTYTENITINNLDGTSDNNRIFFQGVRYNLGDGNDVNDGSKGSPWATIQHAADTINPANGLPIYVYLSGTGNEFPLINPETGEGIRLYQGSSYLQFENLHISVHSHGIGLYLENYINVINCFVDCNEVGGTGIGIGENSKVIGNIVIDCKMACWGNVSYNHGAPISHSKTLNNICIWTPDSRTDRIWACHATGTTHSNVTIKNNIAFADSSQGFLSFDRGLVCSQIHADYNFWIRKTSSDMTYQYNDGSDWYMKYDWDSYKGEGWGSHATLLDEYTPTYVGGNTGNVIDDFESVGNSLGIDAGFNHSEILFDIRGNSRIKNYRMDTGAHEYEPVQMVDD